jgi:hypothetical protein
MDLTALSASVFSEAFLVGVDLTNNQPIMDGTAYLIIDGGCRMLEW